MDILPSLFAGLSHVKNKQLCRDYISRAENTQMLLFVIRPLGEYFYQASVTYSDPDSNPEP